MVYNYSLLISYFIINSPWGGSMSNILVNLIKNKPRQVFSTFLMSLRGGRLLSVDAAILVTIRLKIATATNQWLRDDTYVRYILYHHIHHRALWGLTLWTKYGILDGILTI